MKERELVEYVAKMLVDKPEKVTVKETHGANVTVLELHVDQEDMGRVIGKDGRVAMRCGRSCGSGTGTPRRLEIVALEA